jgi:hypothetical protein
MKLTQLSLISMETILCLIVKNKHRNNEVPGQYSSRRIVESWLSVDQNIASENQSQMSQSEFKISAEKQLEPCVCLGKSLAFG